MPRLWRLLMLGDRWVHVKVLGFPNDAMMPIFGGKLKNHKPSPLLPEIMGTLQSSGMASGLPLADYWRPSVRAMDRFLKVICGKELVFAVRGLWISYFPLNKIWEFWYMSIFDGPFQPFPWAPICLQRADVVMEHSIPNYLTRNMPITTNKCLAIRYHCWNLHTLNLSWGV